MTQAAVRDGTSVQAPSRDSHQMSDASVPEIARGLRLLAGDGGVIEIRALPRGRGRVESGYYGDLARAARHVAALDTQGRYRGVYVTLNRLALALLARATNRMGAEQATSDRDVTQRRWLLVDLDPVRPSGISATAQEHAAALARAEQITAWLADMGWPAPVVVDSGNGAYLLYRIDLPNDEGARELVTGCLRAIGAEWTDGTVTVDTSVGNAARLVRVPGTVNRKGDDTPDRPWRRARILRVPDPLTIVPAASLTQLAALAPTAAARGRQGGTRAAPSGERYDLTQFVARYLGEYGPSEPRPWGNGGRLWVLTRCPYDEAHNDRAAYVGQLGNGALIAGCHHDSCTWSWRDLRARYDPPGTRADNRRARALALASAYETGRTADGRAYARRDGRVWILTRRGGDRDALRDDLTVLWQTRHDDAPPGDRVLDTVITRLVRSAMEQAPDPDVVTPAHDDQQGGEASVTALRDLGAPIPEGYQIPEPWVVGRDGVWTEVPDRDNTTLVRVTWAPILVTGILVEPGGDGLLELAWLGYDGQWVTRAVPRSVAKSGRRLIAYCGDAGIPAVEGSARALERWIATLEAANAEVVPRETIARVLGWQPGDQVFVAGDRRPWRVIPRYDSGARVVAAYQPRGTLEGWQEIAQLAAPYPRAVIALGAAYAAPLLPLLDLPSPVVDLHGRSTSGKTTAALLALSVWADPREHAGAYTTWRLTRLAAEKLLHMHHGLPVVMDETHLARHPEMIEEMIYQVSQNVGTAREGGWPSQLPWRVILITTGERAILDYGRRQGAAARVISIAGAPLGHGPEAGEVAARIRRGILRHHGVAGPAYITWLAAERASGRWDEYVQVYERLTDAYAQGGTDYARRRAPLVAALHLGLLLAHRAGVLPYAPPDVTTWRDILAGDDSTADDRPQDAYDTVARWILANPGRIHGVAAVRVGSGSDAYWERRPYDDPPPAGWAGRLLSDGSVAISPEVVDDVLRRAGYTPGEVRAEWARTGRIHGDQRHHLALIRIGDTRARMYRFAPPAEGGAWFRLPGAAGQEEVGDDPS